MALLVMHIRYFWFMHVFCLRSVVVSAEEYGSPVFRWSSTRARIRFSRCWSEAAGRHQSPHRISRNLAVVGVTCRVPYDTQCYPCYEVWLGEHVKIIGAFLHCRPIAVLNQKF